MAVTNTTLQGILQDFWSKLDGQAPADLFQDVGPMWSMLRKGLQSRNSRVIGGRGVLNFGTSTGLPAAGGPSYSVAMANPGNTTNTEWAVTTVKSWQPLVIDWSVYEFGNQGIASYRPGVLHESERAVKRWHNLHSHHVWQDGSGALGRISTITSGDATNDLVTFVNRASARLFEVGDRCVAAAARTTGGLHSATVATVNKVNENDGQVQFDTNLSGTLSWAANSYVFHDQWRNDTITGFLGWCPNSDPTSTTFFGVDRSVRPDRLGGRRLSISAGGDPYNNILKLIRVATNASARFDCLFVPVTEMEKLQATLADRNQQTYGGPYGKSGPPDMWVRNIEGLKIQDPSNSARHVYVYTDPYMIDIDQTETQDATYFGFQMRDVGLYTGSSRIGWKAYGSSPRDNIDQTNEQTNAFYGAYLQFVQANPNNQVRVSVGVS